MIVRHRHNRIKGFTLIEVMIAITIFIIVFLVGAGALLNLNVVHKKSSDTRSVMDSLGFIFEDISKNIRTGYGFECVDDLSQVSSTPKSCENGHVLAFESFDVSSGDYIQKIYKIDNAGKIFRSFQPKESSPSLTQMNPDEVVILYNKSGFSVLGAESAPGDRQQPLVVIRLFGYIDNKGTITPFSLQTSVSQRSSDI